MKSNVKLATMTKNQVRELDSMIGESRFKANQQIADKKLMMELRDLDLTQEEYNDIFCN